MKKNNLITPEGTRDLLFKDCLMLRHTEDKIHSIFKRKGYNEIITPGIEFFDVFSDFSQESMYKLVDNKGRLLVVRPDSTIPIARVVATRLKEAYLPLRLFYSQSLYEAKPSMKGKNSEFVQSGIELIGSNSKKADLEVLCTAVEVLSSCDKENFRLEIGDSGLFTELVKKLNIDDDVIENIRALIESKNYPALNDLLDKIGTNEVTNALKKLPSLFGGEEVFENASSLFSDDKIDIILKNLKDIYTQLSKLGYNNKNIIVDLGIVNRTDYYTGVIMKGYLEGYGEVVLSGGRYDKLIAEFGYDIPATGFAVNINAVTSILKKKLSIIDNNKIDAIVFAEDGYEIEAIKYANELISQGKNIENAVFDDINDVLEYASSSGVTEIIVISECIKTINIGVSNNDK